MTQGGDRRHRIVVAIASLAILGGAFVVFALFVATRDEPPVSERRPVGPLVEVVEVTRGRHEITVDAHGRAIAAREIVIQPEVSGRVVWHAPQLAPGGRFKKGEPMFKLDARDYGIAADARRADVSRAELELRIEKGMHAVAQKEWESFGASSPTARENRDLALREPQLRAAQVALDAAKSGLDKALLDLERTTVKAPFDGVVVLENIGVGMVVGPASQLGTFVATDEFWVTVSIPSSAVARLRFPTESSPGSAVTVRYRAGDVEGTIQGELLRLLPDVDPQGSMARIITRIPSPLDQTPPLLLGTYVSVAIEAEPLDDAAEIPRAALQEGDVVYVMTPEETLEIRPVTVAWERNRTLLVTEGLAEGELLVTSPIATSLPGMALRRARPRAEAELTRLDAGAR